MKRHKCLLLIILALLCQTASAQIPLAVEAFNQKLTATPQGQLLDVRTSDEYAQGHLSNSQNLDVKDPVFVQKLATLDKDKPVFVYCLSGGRSAKAAKLMVENGFKEVYEMQGGFLKWSSAKMPFEKDENAAAAPTGMSEEEFQKLIASDQPVLIDFFAKWCAPCQQMLPTIHKLTEEYKGRAIIETIDYDKNKALAQRLKVDEIPVFLLYKNGKLLWRGMGLMPEKEFRAVIEDGLRLRSD